MTALKSVALWAVAVCVAGWVLVRIARGRPAVLRSGRAMRVVRVVALALVLCGARRPSALAQPIPDRPDPAAGARSDFPTALREPAILQSSARVRGSGAWAAMRRELFAADASPPTTGRLQRARHAAAALGNERSAGELSRRLEAHIDRLRAAQRVEVDSLLSILQAAEDVPLYDAPLAAWLFRSSAGAAGTAHDRARLLARIERHLRVSESLVRAQAVTGPILRRPWILKSGPPPGYQPFGVPAALGPTAERLYPSTRPEPWERDACLEVSIAQRAGPIAFEQGGVRTEPVASPVRLCRLSLLEVRSAPAVLRHPLLGDVVVPADTAVHSWTLPDLLSPDARERIGRWIRLARRGDPRAARLLESTLLASHGQIRASLRAEPTGPGAGRLRTLLALFDE